MKFDLLQIVEFAHKQFVRAPNAQMGVLRMATVMYGKYMLISRPHYDEKFRLWFPYASISWDADKFHFHQLNDFEKSFQTEEEALAFGFIAARNWMDEHESRPNYDSDII